jgi:enamine deaminase RidA (YjgF/YER057c/UK114 family)/DNA-directed RNA polymerase subunit RPC12/RpoP
MPIVFSCQCGKEFNAKDDNAGKRARCPQCRREFVIPNRSVFGPIEPTTQAEPPPLPPNMPPVFAVPVSDAKIQHIQAEDASRPFYRDPIIVVGATIPTLILTVFFGYLFYEHRTKEFHRRVYALKLEVDDLVKSGQSRAALDKCDEVLSAIGDPAAADVKMRGYADVVSKTRDRLNDAVQAEKKREEADRQAKAEADRQAKAEADRLAAEAEAAPIPAKDMPEIAEVYIHFAVVQSLRSLSTVQDVKISGLTVQRLRDDPRKLSWLWRATMQVTVTVKPHNANLAPDKGSMTWVTVFRCTPDKQEWGECWRESTSFKTGKTSRINMPLCEFEPEFRRKVTSEWLRRFKYYKEFMEIPEQDQETRLEQVRSLKLDICEGYKISMDELPEILESTD